MGIKTSGKRKRKKGREKALRWRSTKERRSCCQLFKLKIK
jgi:hypothetical protein